MTIPAGHRLRDAGGPAVADLDFRASPRRKSPVARPIAMRVWLDPDKLAARGLTAGDIASALRANNVQAAPGQLKNDDTIINITATTDATDIPTFREMVIKRGPVSDQGIVRLKDIATLELGGQNYNASLTLDRRPSVGIALSPTPDGNPLNIVAGAKKLIPEMQKLAPPRLVIESAFDVTHFVNASINEVEHTLLEAVVIVVLVIFLFLGSLRAMVISDRHHPVVDGGYGRADALTGILDQPAHPARHGARDRTSRRRCDRRRRREHPSPYRGRSVSDRRRPSSARARSWGRFIAMTITLAAVYAPIGMMGGLTGSLFKEFAFTLAGSVCVSGVIALTLSPMMSSRLLKSDVAEGCARYDYRTHLHLARTEIFQAGRGPRSPIARRFCSSRSFCSRPPPPCSSLHRRNSPPRRTRAMSSPR